MRGASITPKTTTQRRRSTHLCRALSAEEAVEHSARRHGHGKQGAQIAPKQRLTNSSLGLPPLCMETSRDACGMHAHELLVSQQLGNRGGQGRDAVIGRVQPARPSTGPMQGTKGASLLRASLGKGPPRRLLGNRGRPGGGEAPSERDLSSNRLRRASAPHGCAASHVSAGRPMPPHVSR